MGLASRNRGTRFQTDYSGGVGGVKSRQIERNRFASGALVSYALKHTAMEPPLARLCAGLRRRRILRKGWDAMADQDRGTRRAVVPYVIETTPRGERSYDVYSRLLKDRIIFLGMQIDDRVANAIVAQLLFLSGDDPSKEINIYINSPGGAVNAGMAIYDTMQSSKAPIATFCVGMAASMAATILMAGTPGKRFALPHSRILIHPVSGGFQGAIPDLAIHAREMMRTVETQIQIMARHTGQTPEKIKQDTQRDYYMDADEARAYGIIDEVVRPGK